MPDDIKIKDFYQTNELSEYAELLVNHLLNKHEDKKGILVLKAEGSTQYFGIKNIEVLKRGLIYYNGLPGSSAHWYYITDLQKQQAVLCEG